MKNTFLEYGYSEEDIENKVNDSFYNLFEGMNRVYFEGIGNTGYLMDTGNCDARTEGMSYGMMMCVLMDRKDLFDRLWKFSLDFMYMTEGPLKGYFAWSVAPDGKKNAWGPAPDGEEFYAMALLLAAKKWNNSDYEYWAKKILNTVLHHDIPMWEKSSALIRFVPGCSFSDPSYHLMHFYEEFAKYSNESDRKFWKKAAVESRKYLIKACHPLTGMNPEYGNFDGTPNPYGPPENHGDFYSDAYRTGANIGLDVLWNGPNKDFSKIADNLINFFADIPTEDFMKYKIDGTVITDEKGNPEKALHPIGLLATLAQTTLACSLESKKSCEKIINRFWNTPMRTGERRYYDNCLYMFAMLALSGKYTPEV